jgi:glycosyltransferase involved in cell wall biosynthesis
VRILVLISSLRGGGAERAAVTLSRLWTDGGHTVRLTTIDSAKSDVYDVDPRVSRGELDLERPSPTIFHAVFNNLRRVAATRREIKTFAPDIVVALMPTANVLAAVSAIGLPAKVIGCERSHPPQIPMDRLRELARKTIYGLLDATAALTTETADWLKANTRARRVHVIPNVVVWPLQETTPHVAPDAICSAGRSITLAAGRLDPQKGFDELIDAFANVAQSRPGWDLVILGEGPLRADLEQQIRLLNLSDRILMPGRVGNIADWYARASLYVMSSRHEGFPNVLAEAMAHGLPAISYDCDTGPRDIIRHDIDGVLVPPGDTKALADSLADLMADEGRRNRYAARAPDVRARFSTETVMRKWNALFAELMQR